MTENYSFAEKKRIRKSFEKISSVMSLPDILEIQTDSYKHFLQSDIDPEKRKDQGLEQVFRSIFPIVSVSGNAKIDYLFEQHPRTVGILDGGNEIGSGNYIEEIIKLGNIIDYPSIITATESIISSTSNWGAFGLIAGLSIHENINLLPSVDEGKRLIEKTYNLGAVEGLTGESKPYVDGRSLEEDMICLKKLNSLF